MTIDLHKQPHVPIMKRHDLYKRSRSCPVTCLSFGQDRRSQYPDFFFCHGCDQLEDAVLVSNIKGARREMKKYMCTGGHTDVSHPTTLKKQYRPKHRKNAAAPSGKPVLHNKNPRDNPDSLGTSSTAVADGKNSAMQSAGKESPSRSPTKKKRCQYRRRRVEQEDSDEDDVSSTSPDGGKNDALASCSSSPDCAPLPDPQILFSSNTSNSEGQELMTSRTISSVTPPESAARNDMFSATRQGKEEAHLRRHLCCLTVFTKKKYSEVCYF
jgi:hypothetical protein